ncbi:MAG: protein stimulating phenylphosphate synthetase activity [Rhodospirillaceae bacterium]|nr:protein stimulating phenylphosphate synthetase activity [Rhodospirillaceae bacterium]
MIVRNWMKTDPETVTSDTLVADAKRTLIEKNLRVMPVVDHGDLRGVITRASCLRAAEFVSRGQDPHEFDYFVNRLKVKDLMARRPATVDANDTMEHCLRRGQDEDISQFPVLEGGELVGIISASEIFSLAARVLGAWESWSGVTLSPMVITDGVMSEIAKVVDDSGGTMQSMFSVDENGGDLKKIILRFQTDNFDGVMKALEDAGYTLLEASSEVQNNGATIQ